MNINLFPEKKRIKAPSNYYLITVYIYIKYYASTALEKQQITVFISYDIHAIFLTLCI